MIIDGSSGKLKKLLDRLTAVRAGLLDYIEDIYDAVTAMASTALSTTNWTNARAAKLDNLDAVLSTLGMIASIQYVSKTLTTTATSGAATITAIDTAKTILIPAGAYSTASGIDARDMMFRVEITNTTTLTFRRWAGATETAIFGCWAVQFK